MSAPTVASQVNLEKALSIGGWMSEQELTWLASEARNCKRIVEFGVLHGRTTRALADNAPIGAKIWAVDPWKGDYIYEDGSKVPINTYVMPYFIQNLEDHIKEHRVIPVRIFSYQFSLPFEVDMVFIDGDHRYETVVKDIRKAYELVRNGGVISGHDYNHPAWPGVKQAVDELIGNVQTEGHIWWTVKS